MISNEERREAARKLRADVKNSMEIGYRCSNSEIELYICDILGLRCSECAHSWSGLEELADIIEPHEPHCIANVTIDGEELERIVNKAVKEAIGIDRDALLKLAYFMDRVAVEFMDTAPHEFNPCTLAKAWAREIREALGVQE